MLSPSRIKDRLFYGWVIVATFFAIGTIIFGARFSFGIFFKSIESEFTLTRAATSAIFSVLMVLGSIFALLGGWALDRYGPRIVILLMGIFTGLSLLLTSQTNSLWQLFLTYSVLLSIGTGAIFVVQMSTISRWFDKKRGLAMGIVSSGSGLGTFVIAPFATYLISHFGWRMSYVLMGLIASLILIPLSRLLRKDPHEIGALADGAKPGSRETGIQKPENKEDNPRSTGLSLPQVYRVRNFWLMEFIWLLYSSCLFIVMAHIVPHATDIGIPAVEAAFVLSLIGGTSIAGRVLMGRVSDNIGRKQTSIICALLMAGAMVWLIPSQDLWMLYLFALVFGFSFGGLTPPLTALIGDTFGLRNIGMILGMLEIGWGIGSAIGPAIGGIVFDISKNYSMAFLGGAAAMLVTTLLITLLRQERSRDA